MEQSSGICELVLISPDPYIQEQVRIALDQGDQWSLRVVDDPDALGNDGMPEPGRVYVVASSYLRTASTLPAPLIVHGPASDLPSLSAFRFEDYLAEPWGTDEFRYRADRLVPAHVARLSSGSLAWSRTSLEAIRHDGHVARTQIPLTHAMMLDLLVRARAEPVPREALAAVCTSIPAGGRALDMAVSRLRRTLFDVTEGWETRPVLRAVRCEGYVLSG